MKTLLLLVLLALPLRAETLEPKVQLYRQADRISMTWLSQGPGHQYTLQQLMAHGWADVDLEFPLRERGFRWVVWWFVDLRFPTVVVRIKVERHG